jgi:hypothetical protein
MEFKTKEIISTKTKTESRFENAELDGKSSTDEMQDSQSRPEIGKRNDHPDTHDSVKTKQ